MPCDSHKVGDSTVVVGGALSPLSGKGTGGRGSLGTFVVSFFSLGLSDLGPWGGKMRMRKFWCHLGEAREELCKGR